MSSGESSDENYFGLRNLLHACFTVTSMLIPCSRFRDQNHLNLVICRIKQTFEGAEDLKKAKDLKTKNPDPKPSRPQVLWLSGYRR